MSIITLTTDFGLYDEYVGLMKGVILSLTPETHIVDITHAIPPQDIYEAARTIAHSYTFFPKKTIHLVVVDPGVGSNRAILCLEVNDHLFVGPDNGIFTPLLSDSLFQNCYRINNHHLFLKQISPTFHGRDIMAPIAAHLANGLSPRQTGERQKPEDCCHIHLPKAVIKEKMISGEIISIDHFGNLRTSISKDDLTTLPLDAAISLLVGEIVIKKICKTYSDVPTGETTAIIDSRNHLEIGIHCGNGATLLGCRVGTPVALTFKS